MEAFFRSSAAAAACFRFLWRSFTFLMASSEATSPKGWKEDWMEAKWRDRGLEGGLDGGQKGWREGWIEGWLEGL